jgi:adenylate cyclase
MGHAMATRGLHEAFAVHGNYRTELIGLFIFFPGFGVLQVVLLVIAWLHACIGLHAWLRLKPWYAARESILFATAVLWPALALAGYVSGGMQVVRRAADAGWIEQVAGDAGLTMEMIGWALYWQSWATAGFALLLRACSRCVHCANGGPPAPPACCATTTASPFRCAPG